MKNYTYKPKEKAFLAVIHFIHKPDGTPYTGSEIASGDNAKPFDSKWDSRLTIGGQWIHDDRQALSKLESMVAKWKKNIFSGYIVARTGEKIYTWQKDCVFKVCGIPNWEYIKKANGQTDIRLKNVTTVRDLSITKQMPINYTTLDTITYKEKIQQKEKLISLVVQEQKQVKPLTRKEQWEQRWYGK